MRNSETLSILLRQLANVTNKATTRSEAIEKALPSYLCLDNYPMYGGYNLVTVNVDSGGYGNSFNSFSSHGNRVPAKVMIEKIRSFMDGLTYLENK